VVKFAIARATHPSTIATEFWALCALPTLYDSGLRMRPDASKFLLNPCPARTAIPRDAKEAPCVCTGLSPTAFCTNGTSSCFQAAEHRAFSLRSTNCAMGSGLAARRLRPALMNSLIHLPMIRRRERSILSTKARCRLIGASEHHDGFTQPRHGIFPARRDALRGCRPGCYTGTRLGDVRTTDKLARPTSEYHLGPNFGCLSTLSPSRPGTAPSPQLAVAALSFGSRWVRCLVAFQQVL